ncbi:MAG: 4Fe-4S dicluster domain-containing protein [Dysgonamonadaceae bacterium]|nr:4Fe-4S dicluster domain-containing protein [Dysgonamonadaceae bacterium]
MIYICIGIIIFLWITVGFSRRRRRRRKIIFVSDCICVGCRRCVRRCRHDVLEALKGERGTRVTVKRPERCTACGKCIDKCMYGALKLIERV